ncbi:S-methyl-5-thioribose-1-phosphate isomerase [Massospora cicadina]|nr:S-methyl-5-thioribose-1-phosphate isomerase [Massospora cicadina]
MLSNHQVQPIKYKRGELLILDQTQLPHQTSYYSIEPVQEAHCTAGYGTAVGVIRSLHKLGKLEHVYCAETRPYEQGPHLTAYELEYENISANLICNSMVAALLSKGLVDGIVVGAERVARNGDTTNKVGTLQLAKLADEFKIPFIVAAPTNSIGFNTFNGLGTSIEECSPNKVTSSSLVSSGSDIVTVTVAHPEVAVWSPEFDVTPSSLVTAIATERGVFVKEPSKEEYDPQTLLAE